MMKPIAFVGDALGDLRRFPEGARRRVGYQLDRIQRGAEPNDWKPMTSIGPEVREIRVRDVQGAFRVIYLASFVDAIYVLHAFEKRTQRTTRRDLDIAIARFRQIGGA